MRFFGHKRPIRAPDTGEIIGQMNSPVRAVTREKLGRQFGPDHNRRLMVTLEAGDLIVIRPEKTLRPEKMAAVDVYRYMLRCKANARHLEKARETKSAKRARRIKRQIDAADRKRKAQIKANPL